MENLVGKTAKFIGVIPYDEEGRKGFLNVVLTVTDGKIVKVVTLEPGWTQDQAINIATGWIDNHYWNGML